MGWERSAGVRRGEPSFWRRESCRILPPGGQARLLFADATAWHVPGHPKRASRMLNAATPDASATLVRMRSRRPSSQMPPPGTVLRDDKAIDAVSKWLAADLAKR